MPILLKKNIAFSITSVEEAITRRLKRGETNSFLYIVPTKRKLRDLQREFLSIVPAGSANTLFLFTLETLVAHLFTVLRIPKRLVAGPAQAVLMNGAIRSVEEELKYFHVRRGPNAIPKGTFQRILNVITYLKEHGVYQSTLHAEIEAADETERWKLKDILAIYEAYEHMLGTTFTDAAGMLKQLNTEWETEHIAPLFRSSFQGVDTIFVSGFDEFSDPEMTVLYNLSTLGGIGTVVSFDYHLNNDELFGHLRKNYEKFLEMGFHKLSSPAALSKQFTQHITRWLFQYDFGEPRLNAASYVTLFEETDRYAEVDSIAKLIKKIAVQQPGRDLSKFCVAMYQPQIYTDLFREAVQRYGIPANITDRYALDQSPLIGSILALLAVQQNNFRVKDIQRALSSPYFDFPDLEHVTGTVNVREIAALLKVTAGYNSWMSRIERHLTLLAEERLFVKDEFEQRRLLREEQSLQSTRKILRALSKLLRRFEGEMTPREFKRHIVALLKELHVVERIVKIHSSTSTGDLLERDARAYQKLLKFLDEFLDILAFEVTTTAREPLSYYIQRLRTTMSQVRYNVRQKYGYGVYITSFEETRGLQFDVMIIAGLVDGEFPPPYTPENFLSPQHRARQERYHLTEHRYLCYQALTNFTEHLYLSYPKKDGDDELIPSSFINAILRVIEVDDRREAKSNEMPNVIYSPDEMLEHLGRLTGLAAKEHIDILLPSLDEELRRTFDQMSHAISVEKSRAGDHHMSDYEGMILAQLSDEARNAIDRFRKRVFSISQLESYGKCPFQFFADKVLRLNVVSEAEEGLSPLERGGLLHELLFEFYIHRRERGLKPLYKTSEEEFREALGELTTLASRKIDELYIPDVFWDVDKELLLGTPNRKGVLQEFLETERGRVLEVTPAFFEARFGPGLGAHIIADPEFRYEQPIVAGKVQLRGKIDRIELGKNNFTIIDYKSGQSVAKRRDIDLGMSLQLPVYLYAVERILAENMGRTLNGVAGIYYTLKSPVKEELGIGSKEHRNTAFSVKKSSSQILDSDEELRRIIDQAVAFVNDYVDKIAKGEFPVAPKIPQKICDHCDFKTICRIQTTIVLQQESII